MRYATTPRWTFVMLIVMGVGFMAGAGAFTAFVPSPAGPLVGAIWLLMGAGMAFFSYRALAHGRDDARILREGTAATATLLKASTNGWVVNGVPQWTLQLRIDGYGASYETSLKLLTFTPPGDGATFAVRVDPVHKEHVVLGPDAPTLDARSTASTLSDAGVYGSGRQVEAAVFAALRRSGIDVDGGATTTVDADGLRTIAMTSTATSTGASRDPAETVRLLADLDRMHAGGALGDHEFDTIKRKLLGEDESSG